MRLKRSMPEQESDGSTAERGTGARRVSRRGLLGAGVGALAAAAAIARYPAIARGLAMRISGSGSAPSNVLVEPPVRASENGLLDTGLRASVVAHPMAGRTAVSNVYEGIFPGPTLRVHPGDTLRVKLSNDLDQITNLHMHGFHVSPEGNSDNIFLQIGGGADFQYEYHIPDNHPTGLYWYHPHFHTLTTDQVFGGMAGAVIVEGAFDELPGIAGLRERLLLMHATQLDDQGVPITFFNRNQVSYLRTVNGQINPTFTIQPGERQRLRIGNISDSTWFRLKLDGHKMLQIAKDGNSLAAPVEMDEILLAPAERVEVLIVGGAAGSYSLRSLEFDQGFAVLPETVMATLVSQGDPVATPPAPTTLEPFKDLSGLPIDRRREISFQVLPRDDPQRADFEINSKLFDANRVDFVPLLNATEEWVLKNPSNVMHPFHIHINPFQVISVNGQTVDHQYYEDTFTVPTRGEVVIRTQFLDYVGRYVFHCHILPHEDGGMMSVIEVIHPGDPLPPDALDADVATMQLMSDGSDSQFECDLIQ